MSSPESADGDFREICYLMGLALITWQSVEHAHFKIYIKMLNVPLDRAGSIAYYGVESFDVRRRIVSAMARYFMEGREFKKQRADWQELEKLLKVGNENRNKLAHYTLDYDIVTIDQKPGGIGVTVRLTPHRLRPGRWNFFRQSLGHTPDKEEHNLGPDQIKRYIIDFRQLAGRLEYFHANLVPPVESLPPAAEPSPATPPPHPQSTATPDSEGNPPSAS
jgi:hypothetical protein